MTNPTSASRSGREPKGAPRELDGAAKRTPSTDMQAEDAGTEDSGVDAHQPGAVDSAMKETSKTDSESGGPR
jgi:hypothetical protein